MKKNRWAKAIRFFKSRPPGFWWVMGLVWGDGNIYSGKGNHRVSIGCCGELKDKLKKTLEVNVYQNKKVDDFWNVYMDSKELVEWFTKEWGMGGPKAAILKLPDGLAGDDFWDFVRGFFDADGCVVVGHGRRGLDKLEARLSSKSEGFLQSIADYVEKMHGVDGLVYRSIKRMGGKEFLNFSLIYKSFDRAEKFLELLYANKGKFYYKRKFREYQEFLNLKAVRPLLCEQCGVEKAFTKEGICFKCMWKSKREYCSCGERAISGGLCSFAYTRYRRANALNVYEKIKFYALSEDLPSLLDKKDFFKLNRYLKMSLVSYYMAKHESFLSPVEYWAGRGLGDLSHEIHDARRMKSVKPASWFRVEHAYALCTKLKDEYGVTSILDPFCGWGARAVGALLAGIKYQGRDLNKLLIHELRSILGKHVEFKHENAFKADYKEVECDAILASPPYWEAEIYGYKNLSVRRYGSFLRRMEEFLKGVFSNGKIKVVGLAVDDFTIHNKRFSFVDDMEKVIQKLGYKVSRFVYGKLVRTFYDDTRDLTCLFITKT